MRKNYIQADVIQMPVISLDLSFSVHIKWPVEMPPRIYTISMQEIYRKDISNTNKMRLFREILSEKVLYDYNRLIEDSPIMDMFADPIKYETCSDVEWTFVGDHYDEFIKSK